MSKSNPDLVVIYKEPKCDDFWIKKNVFGSLIKGAHFLCLFWVGAYSNRLFPIILANAIE